MMRWVRFLLLLSLVIAIPVSAQVVVRGVPSSRTETVTVSTTAIGTTICNSSDTAIAQVKTQGIFYTLHSSTATPASTDFDGSVGDIIVVSPPSKLRMIRSGAADATVKIQCVE